MIAVIQRVSSAQLSINDSIYSSINKGLLLLIGIGNEDTIEDVEWLSQKIIGLRIFQDNEGKMNLSLKEINGELLIVSQFTLFASTKKGNRPSFIEAARPEIAIPMYEAFITACEKSLSSKVKTGQFGADMKINLTNDGPVTITIDTKNKK
jgi:D-tyrosyl-tRNA(Tyr) deacylase